MKGKQKQLLFALVIAVIAVVANVMYINTVKQDSTLGKKFQVVKAKEPLKSGDVLRKKHFEFVKVPDNYRPRASVLKSDAESTLAGQKLNVDVEKGDYILSGYIGVRQAVGNKLSEQVQDDNYRAVTLPVDQTNSFAISIVSGDVIDIVYTFLVPNVGSKMSVVLLQGVPVISTGTYSAAEHEVGGRGGAPKRYNTLTLKLTAHDAARLTYARQTGKIDILLRKSSDQLNVEYKPISGVEDLLSAADKTAIKQLQQSASSITTDKEQLKAQLQELFSQQRRQRQTTN